MKYYQVTAKCGHVGGPGKYILIDFYTVAENGKAAAAKIRQAGRVKHDHKDAIRSVQEVNHETYIAGIASYNADPYTRCNNPQEQRLVWDQIAPRVLDEQVEEFSRKNKKYEDKYNAKRSWKYGYDGCDMRAKKNMWKYEECA